MMLTGAKFAVNCKMYMRFTDCQRTRSGTFARALQKRLKDVETLTDEQVKNILPELSEGEMFWLRAKVHWASLF